MSGIYGIFSRDAAPPAPEALEAMRCAMAVWGPDGSDVYRREQVGLGHLLLHTTPESLSEKQPLTHPQRPELVITADARLDNRAELSADLGLSGPEGRAASDALLILLAYERWGADLLPRLLGDFAFAIWDGYQREFFCARDPLGCKPFHYYLAPNLFVFASDLRGVLAHPATPRRLNEPLLALYLQAHSYNAEKRLTFFADIVKLPAGHLLRVSGSRATLQQYWSADNIAPLRFKSDGEYEEHLLALLREAVNCRLRSAFPIGSHLSGGIDSTTVTMLAAQGLREQGRELAAAFSWSPPPTPGATEPDERARIEAACAMAGIKSHYLDWGPELVSEVFRRDISLQPTEMLVLDLGTQRAAQRAGIRVLLSGWGGDEGVSFHGRGYLAQLFLHGKLGTLFDELQALAPKSGRKGKVNSLLATFYRQVALPLLPDALAPLVGKREMRDELTDTYLNQDFARRYRRQARRLRGTRARVRPGWVYEQRQLFNFGHLTARCESWAISGAQHNLEYRYPLLDRRIIEFALGVPANQFYRHGERRRVFRRATKGLIPAEQTGRNYKDEPAGLTLREQILVAALVNVIGEIEHDGWPRQAEAFVNVPLVMAAARSLTTLDSNMALVARAVSCLRIGALQAQF